MYLRELMKDYKNEVKGGYAFALLYNAATNIKDLRGIYTLSVWFLPSPLGENSFLSEGP